MLINATYRATNKDNVDFISGTYVYKLVYDSETHEVDTWIRSRACSYGDTCCKPAMNDQEWSRFERKFKMLTCSNALSLKIAFSQDFDIYLNFDGYLNWYLIICSNTVELRHQTDTYYFFSDGTIINDYRFNYRFNLGVREIAFCILNDFGLLKFILSHINHGFGDLVQPVMSGVFV